MMKTFRVIKKEYLVVDVDSNESMIIVKKDKSEGGLRKIRYEASLEKHIGEMKGDCHVKYKAIGLKIKEEDEEVITKVSKID
jgi:hypothetical protein